MQVLQIVYILQIDIRRTENPRALLQGGIPKGTQDDGPVRVCLTCLVYNPEIVSIDYCWKCLHRNVGGQI